MKFVVRIDPFDTHDTNSNKAAVQQS